MPADVESYGRSAVPNPYRGLGPDHNSTAASRLVDKFRRVLYIGVSVYVLSQMNFWGAILRSPLVSHEWFKIGLGGMIAILTVKAYVELYEGMMRKQQVNYENFKNATHAAIILIMLTSVAFHVALWPYYKWNTPLALGLVFFGVIIQFLVIVPVWFQNLAAFVGLAFFLQEYQ